jgi:hypothetical protein
MILNLFAHGPSETRLRYRRRLPAFLALLAGLVGAASLVTVSEATFAANTAATKAVAKQKSFPSTEEAMADFAAAVAAGDLASLRSILGPAGDAILKSGDPVEDREARERFAAAYGDSHKLEQRSDSTAWIVVGKDDWPLPIPVVKRGRSWYFDAKAGKDEILNRRIGRNELYAMQAALAFVDAQQEYYLRNPENDSLLHYAQRFVSAPGKRNGLYFPTSAGENPSPLGPLFDARRAQGYTPTEGGKPSPYHGYYYRILKAQGPKAPGGAYHYVVNGKMIGGFALVAYPATYGNSGVMTFIVNHDGVLYEKDQGPDTAAISRKMTRFNPDETWRREPAQTVSQIR